MTNTTVSPYKQALIESMNFLGSKDDTIFIGQQIVYAGNPMSTTIANVSKEKMIELPVMEEVQMGMTLGLSMLNHTVISFYPRWDFLISATNQLVNHVDKYTIMTGKKPNILIRLGKGSDEPLDPGVQHKNSYLEEFKSMCKNITFHDLISPDKIYQTYVDCYNNGGVHVLVEYPKLYVQS